MKKFIPLVLSMTLMAACSSSASEETSSPESVSSEYTEAAAADFFENRFADYPLDDYLFYDLEPYYINVDNLRSDIIDNEYLTVSLSRTSYDPDSESSFGFQLLVENKADFDLMVLARDIALNLEYVFADEYRTPEAAEGVAFYAHELAYINVEIENHQDNPFGEVFADADPDWKVLTFYVDYYAMPETGRTNISNMRPYGLRPVVVTRDAFNALLKD